jgi:hemoglobin
MYDFWAAVLFGEPGFRGDPLTVHAALGTRVALGGREFGRWLELFDATVDTLFRGQVADHAKWRARRIAATMQRHIAAATEVAAVS